MFHVPSFDVDDHDPTANGVIYIATHQKDIFRRLIGWHRCFVRSITIYTHVNIFNVALGLGYYLPPLEFPWAQIHQLTRPLPVVGGSSRNSTKSSSLKRTNSYYSRAEIAKIASTKPSVAYFDFIFSGEHFLGGNCKFADISETLPPHGKNEYPSRMTGTSLSKMSDATRGRC